jgi:ABC-2 type transport system ATP-binding protein
MLTGFLPPSGGKVTVGGHDMAEHPIAAKKLIGYLPESAPAYTDMTVYGFLNFAAEIRGLRGEAKKSAIQRVVELCFLDSVLHQNVDTLSKGYRHRTCFAQSIIHDPDVLVLDEPTDGLDPNQKHEIRQLIRKMGEKKAIIFSTHILEEVDAACTRAIIIDRGVIVANGTPEELRRKSEWAGAVTLRVQGMAQNEVQGKLNQLRGAKKVTARTDGNRVTVTVFPRTAGDGDLTREVIAATNGWQISELRTEEGRLDEVFYKITMPETKSEIRSPKSEN